MGIKNFYKKRPRIILGVLALAILSGAFFGYRHYQKKKAKEETGPDLAEVKRGDMEERFKELGDITAKNQVDLASKVSGRVIKLFVGEGDTVKAGQKIAVIQPGKTGAERFLPSTVVAPIGGVLLAYVKNPGSSNTNSKFSEVGDYVTGLFESQNPTYMMTVADMGTVIVQLKINEMDILKLAPGMPVDVTVDAIPDEEFPGVVTMMSPRADRESRGGKVFRVEVTLKKNDRRLRTGMTARVSALLEKKEKVLILPLSGLFEENDKEFVYLDIQKDKPKQTLVETGMRTETEVELIKGLKEKDKVHTEKPIEFTAIPKEEMEKKKPKTKKGRKAAAKAARKKSRRARRAARKATR